MNMNMNMDNNNIYYPATLIKISHTEQLKFELVDVKFLENVN